MSYTKRTIPAPNPECPKCGFDSLFYVFQIGEVEGKYDPTVGLHCENRNCGFEVVDSTSRFEEAVEKADPADVEFKGAPGIFIEVSPPRKRSPQNR